MSAILTVAQTAYELSNSTLKTIGTPTSNPTRKNTSLWHYWPVITAVTTCLITTVNAIALSIIGNIALGALLSIAAISAGVLSIYLWSISSLKDLEGYVEILSEKVSVLSKTALRLSDANKELDKTRTSLKEEAEERKIQFEQAKAEISRAMKQLDHVTNDLQKSQNQVIEMKKILDGSQEVISKMTSKIGNFVLLNQNVSNSSQTLSEELSSLQCLGKRLGSTIQGLDKENKELIERKEQAELMAKGIYTQFIQIGELLIDLRKERELFESNLHSLQTVDSNLGTHTQELSHIAENLAQGASQTQAVLDTIKPYDGLAEFIKGKLSKSQGHSDK